MSAQQSMFEMQRGANFSPCRTWRYSLQRIWSETLPLCGFIGLNPSTADETEDDPTIRRCIRFCQDWGYGGYLMFNVFAFRATDPKVMERANDPVGPENDEIIRTRSQCCGRLLAAWGNHKLAIARGQQLCKLLNREILCLERNKNGSPKHPLYVRADVKPIVYYTPEAKR